MKTLYAMALALVPITFGAQLGCSSDSANPQAPVAQAADTGTQEDTSESVPPEQAPEGEGEEGPTDSGTGVPTPRTPSTPNIPSIPTTPSTPTTPTTPSTPSTPIY